MIVRSVEGNIALIQGGPGPSKKAQTQEFLEIRNSYRGLQIAGMYFLAYSALDF